MRENQPSVDDGRVQRKKVSIQERAVVVGNMVVVNGYKVNRTLLKQRFIEGGYVYHETSHFLLFTRSEMPTTIIVHWFSPETTPSLIKQCIIHELEQFHQLEQGDDYATILQGVLDSMGMQEIQMQERSVPIEEILFMNGSGLTRRSLKQRFLQSGYSIQETPHFLFCTREKDPATLLVHWFAPEDMDTNVSRHLVEELKPFGYIPNSIRLGEFMTGIVGTTFPGNVRRAWYYFGANTLQHLLRFVSTAAPDIPPDYGTLEMSATLYQRVCELCVGDRFLDAGCNSGFFALLLAERRPFVKEIVGVDIDKDVFTTSKELAAARNLPQVRYVQVDLLTDDICTLGSFDTVIALHVLEHFTEADMYCVLGNLLQVTAHRLILAVPYEENLTIAYDHLQSFSHKKLEAVGAWCIKQLAGTGKTWCEDVAGGGLLLIEK